MKMTAGERSVLARRGNKPAGHALAEMIRRHALNAREDAAEIGRVVIAKFGTDLLDRQCREQELSARFQRQPTLDKRQRRRTKLIPAHAMQVRRTDADGLCIVRHAAGSPKPFLDEIVKGLRMAARRI